MMLAALSAYESQVLPKHVYEGKDYTTNPALNAPIGTGPFVFKEWRKGDFVHLERNPERGLAPRIPDQLEMVIKVMRSGVSEGIGKSGFTVRGVVHEVCRAPLGVPLRRHHALCVIVCVGHQDVSAGIGDREHLMRRVVVGVPSDLAP